VDGHIDVVNFSTESVGGPCLQAALDMDPISLMSSEYVEDSLENWDFRLLWF
jgi:hypothetical protein